MAVLKRLSKEEISENFDYYGYMFGIVPVYVGDPYGQARIAVRNWVPEWVMDVMEVIHRLAVAAIQSINQEFEPTFAIRLKGKIKAI